MKILRLIALPLLMLPLIGSTCSEEKLVTLSIGFPTIAQFIASGELNTHEDSDIVDVKNDIDIAGELESAGIDPQTLDDDAVKIIQIFYRIVQADPEGTREIVNGELEVVEVDPNDNEIGPPVITAQGFSAAAGAVTDWIDITAHFTDPGIAYFNAFLADCVREIKGTGPPVNGRFKYTVRGDSNPGNVETDFVWEIKIVFQGTFQKQFDVVFGA